MEKNFTSFIPTVHLLGELERFGGPFYYDARTVRHGVFGRVAGKELDVAAMVPDGGVDGAVEQFPTLTDKREKKELANLL